MRDIADEGGGLVDPRPGGAGEDPELRRLLLGRAAKLERLGLAEPIGSARWELKPGLEPTLRELGIRGDIIKTMHRAMAGAGPVPDVTGFALHFTDLIGPIGLAEPRCKLARRSGEVFFKLTNNAFGHEVIEADQGDAA